MLKEMRGMTLIELVTVVAIVGMLTAIAVPSYRSYVLRANRSEAKTTLLSTAGALERCFTRFNSYNDAACPVKFPVATDTGKYSISRNDAAGDDASVTFSLKADAQGGQTKDTKCGSLTLNSASVRGVSGTGGAAAVAECWGR
jgi:type IV pilus assembly protein PilE